LWSYIHIPTEEKFIPNKRLTAVDAIAWLRSNDFNDAFEIVSIDADEKVIRYQTPAGER